MDIKKIFDELKQRWTEEVPIKCEPGQKYIVFGQEYVTDGSELLIDTRNMKFYPIKIRFRDTMKTMVIEHPMSVPCGVHFDVIEVNTVYRPTV